MKLVKTILVATHLVHKQLIIKSFYNF